MLKILQARLQQYVNCEIPHVQAGFRKGRRTRDEIANIRWVMEKAREFRGQQIAAIEAFRGSAGGAAAGGTDGASRPGAAAAAL